MRRVWALVAVATAVLAAAACSGNPERPGSNAQPITSASEAATAGSASPSAPVDPAVTRQVCAAAVGAAADGAKLFNEQLAVLERAAARGDEATMIVAAKVINGKLTEMATALGAFARRAVSPPVGAALTEASATLTEMASETYPGSPADIRTTLNGLGATFSKACA